MHELKLLAFLSVYFSYIHIHWHLHTWYGVLVQCVIFCVCMVIYGRTMVLHKISLLICEFKWATSIDGIAIIQVSSNHLTTAKASANTSHLFPWSGVLFVQHHYMESWWTHVVRTGKKNWRRQKTDEGGNEDW